MTDNQIIAEKDGSLTVNVNAGEVTLVNKDLTDEEIKEIEKDYFQYDSWTREWSLKPLEFARAILKKASEK